MEEDNTLDLMATHDFNTPVNVTVIFEENDEDTNTLIDVSPSTQHDNAFKLHKDIIRGTNEKNNNTLVSTPVENSKSLNVHSKNNLEEVDNFRQEINKQTNLPNHEALKRKNGDNILHQTKICKQNKGPYKENVSMVLTAPSDNNKNKNGDQYQHNKSNPNIDTFIDNIVIFSQENCSGINPIINSHDIYTNQQKYIQQNDNCARTATCLKDLLYTVSEHLTFIMKILYNYTKTYRNKTNHPNITEHAKNHYYRTKYHLFDLSYSTVINLIIPKENDHNFINNFLTSTIKLASIKRIPCSYQQLKIVFYDMIMWTKQKKMQVYSQNTNDSFSEVNLRPQSHVHNPNCQPKPAVSTDIDNIYIFSCGPPRNEVPINTESKVINYQSRLPEYPNNHTGNVIRENIPRIYDNQTNHYAATQNAGFINCQPYSCGDQRSSAMSQEITLPKSADRRYRYVPSLPPHPSQYSASVLWQSQDVMPQNTCVENQIGHPHTADQTTNQPETDRSSVSRDSGFISPLNFNSRSNNQQITQISQGNERVEEQQKSRATPLITHVTSLNPNVSYICDGSCFVCGKTTKTKCLGCYKYYYCSHQCQMLDWKSHMTICEKNDATRQFTSS